MNKLNDSDPLTVKTPKYFTKKLMFSKFNIFLNFKFYSDKNSILTLVLDTLLSSSK